MFDSGAKRLFMIVLVLNGLAGLALIVIYSSSQKAPPVVVEQPAAQAPQPELGKVVVTKKSLNFGDELLPDDLRVVAWPANALPPGSFSGIEDIFEGAHRRVALRSIEVNEPVLKMKVSGFGGKASLSHVITPGMRAVSIRVNEQLGVAGFVLPGDKVDVMLTRKDVQQASVPMTHILLQDVRVLAVDQAIEGQTKGPRVVDTVTVEVSIEQVQKLILAQQVGTITLTLRNSGPNSEEVRPRTARVDDLTPAWEAYKPKPRIKQHTSKPEPTVDEGPKVTVYRATHMSRESVERDTAASRADAYGYGNESDEQEPTPHGGPAIASDDSKENTGKQKTASAGEPVRLVPPNYNTLKKKEDTDHE